MRIVLLGPPGSGKAELSRMISSHYGMSIITVSSVMQRAAAEQSELGRLAKEAMDMSRVSDELLLALLRIQLPQMDLSRGFVLVDLPKNAGQADVLDSLLSDLGATIELVLNLEVDPDELMERLVGRITCDSCGAQYNLYVNPPLVDGVCDECGARVVRRPDDYEETISNRLRVYEAQMGPLLQYYRMSDRLQSLAADDGPNAAWKVLRGLIDELKRSRPAVSATKESSVASKAGSGGTAQRKAKKPVSAAKPEATDKDVGGRKEVAKSIGGTQKTPAKAASGGKQAPRRAASGKAGVTQKSTPKGVKKATPKTATTKKVATKRVSAKQSATKKAVAKKTSGKKSLAKKAASKKSVVRQVAPKKATVKKVAAAKGSAKRPGKKAGVRKVAAKKTPARRPAAKKAPVKKALAKKSVAKRATAKAKKVPTRKRPVVKKAATAKAKATRKRAAKRPAAGGSSAKKAVQKKKAKTPAKRTQRR